MRTTCYEPTTLTRKIELWGKENPKAVRNFLQLAMEGTNYWFDRG